MRAFRTVAPLALVVLLIAGASLHCNMGRFVVRTSAPAFGKAMTALTAYQDPELARQAAPALLALLEGFLASDPTNRMLLGLLAQGLFEYTFGFLYDDYERLRETDAAGAQVLRRRARAQFLRVHELGLRLLATHGVRDDFKTISEAALRRRVARLGKEAVPALTWTAVGAGTAMLLGLDQPWLLELRSKVPLLLERVLALQPEYANALPVAALGLYWARDPSTGGSALKAQRYFEQAIRLTGRRFLMWLVVYARNWAWQFQSVTRERVGFGAAARQVPLAPTDKKALYVQLLAEVKRFDLASAPALRLGNTLAKRLARRLESRIEDFLSDQRQVRPALARRHP